MKSPNLAVFYTQLSGRFFEVDVFLSSLVRQQVSRLVTARASHSVRMGLGAGLLSGNGLGNTAVCSQLGIHTERVAFRDQRLHRGIGPLQVGLCD